MFNGKSRFLVSTCMAGAGSAVEPKVVVTAVSPLPSGVTPAEARALAADLLAAAKAAEKEARELSPE